MMLKVFVLLDVILVLWLHKKMFLVLEMHTEAFWG